MKFQPSSLAGQPPLYAPPVSPIASVVQTLIGTDDDDLLNGSDLDDLINGRSGDDTIRPMGGNDTVIGGEGLDWIFYVADYGDLGITYSALTGRFTITDTVTGRWGTDTVSGVEYLYLQGGSRSYTSPLVAKTPGVTLVGGDDNDALQGGPGGDSLYGGNGDDRLTGGAGNDLLIDYYGINTAVFSGRLSEYTIGYNPLNGFFTVTDRIGDRDGTDSLSGGVSSAQFSDGERSLWEVIQLSGTSANDRLNGSANDNVIFGNGGNDSINGGPGTDAAGYLGRYAEYEVTLNPATGVFTVTDLVAGRDGVDTVQNTECLQFSDGRIPIGVSAGGQVFLGTDGNDALVGGPGDDSLYGGKGGNSMTGLEGNDLISGSADFYDLAIYRGNLADYVITWDSSSNIYSVADKVPGRDGKDLLILVERLQFADAIIAPVSSPGGITQIGNESADNLQGSSGPDHLEGAGGNDTITCGNGNDVALGDAGDDSIDGDAGTDTLFGGAGDDSLDGGADDDRLTGGSGNDRLQGRAGFDTAVFSGNFADYLIQLNPTTGSAKVSDQVPGRDGIDTLSSIERLEFADFVWQPLTGLPGANGSGIELVGIGGLLTLDGG